MRLLDVLYNPSYKVVFEGPFYQLVEQIGGQELIDFSTRKFLGEELSSVVLEMVKSNAVTPTNCNTSNNPIVFPQFLVGECFN